MVFDRSLIQEYFTQIGVTISGRVLFFSAIQDNLCAIVISPLKDIPNATEYDDCLTFLPGLSQLLKYIIMKYHSPFVYFFKIRQSILLIFVGLGVACILR